MRKLAAARWFRPATALSIPLVLLLILSWFALAAGRGRQGNVATDTFDVTKVDWDLSEDPPPADGAHEGPALPNDTSEADPWCGMNPSVPPSQTFTYKTFTVAGPPGIVALKADVYLPTPVAGAGPYPIMILVHGGGWAKGCRLSMDGVAYSFARVYNDQIPYHFIAISIDYRLACNSQDPDLSGSIVQPLCDWTYSRLDSVHNAPGAAIYDVQDAVSYVRNTWGPAHSNIWNNTIALVGGSAGANISFVAAALAQGSARPDALVGWSPFPQFTQYGNPNVTATPTVWGCQSPTPLVDRETNDWIGCAVGSPSHGDPSIGESGVNRYLPCPTPSDPTYQTGCAGLYTSTGLYDVAKATASLPPPVFFANGGGPVPGLSSPELVALQTEYDLRDFLATTPVPFTFCPVDQPDHGTRLLPDSCEGAPTGQTVKLSTELFLELYVCPDPQYPQCNG